LKVVFDQNVPIGLVRVLQTFAKEHQFRKISGNFEIKAAADYTPQPGDDDYRPNNDVPWLKRFADAGGNVVISGDTNMKSRAHERLALIEGGFVVIFFEPQWSNWKFWRKCALLIHWWPVIAAKIRRAKKASFYHVPCNWTEDGKLRWVSNKDPKLLKIERKAVAQRKSAKKVKPAAPKRPSDGPLFEFAATETEGTDG
jgi:PIN like domain